MEKNFLKEIKEKRLDATMYTNNDLEDLIKWGRNKGYIANIIFVKTLTGGRLNIENGNGRITLRGKAYLDETFDLNVFNRNFLGKIENGTLTGESYNKNDLEDLIIWGEQYGYIAGIIHSRAMNGNHSVSSARLTREGKSYLNN